MVDNIFEQGDFLAENFEQIGKQLRHCKLMETFINSASVNLLMNLPNKTVTFVSEVQTVKHLALAIGEDMIYSNCRGCILEQIHRPESIVKPTDGKPQKFSPAIKIRYNID
jgi:hypothetical protein